MLPKGRPVRLCIPIAKYPPQFSGGAFLIDRTIRHYADLGIEPTILTYRPPETRFTEGHKDRARVDRLLVGGSDPLSKIRRIYQLRRFFRDRAHQFDLVHSALNQWEFLLNIRYVKSMGLPIIMDMALLFGDDPAAILQESLGRFKMRLLEHVDVWVGLSAAFGPRVRAAGIPESRFRLIYGAVDAEIHQPAEPEARARIRADLGLPRDGRIAISVGSIVPRKGMDRVLRAWARVGPKPGRDLLVIVGPASLAEGLEIAHIDHAESIQRLAASPPLAGTVLLTGRREDVAKYMAASDVFLFLSRREGLGLVILEAMATGLPCVVSPLDGIAAEMIEHGRSGFIASDPDDADGLGLLIQKLLSSPEERRTIGERAREVVVQRFSFEARAEAISQLYRDVLGDRDPRIARS